MRPGQNKRMRGRNRRGPNPLTRSFESNGPDVKIRGTASHIAEKYVQLARDAHASGDPVAAESYLQHAEHYLRLIAAAQLAQFQAQQAAMGIKVEESEELDDDEFESAVMDRFTFRAPTAPGQQPSDGSQPDLPPRAEFQGQPRQEQQRGEYQPRGDQPRHDNRDRNFGDRNQGERPFNDRNRDRGDFRRDRNFDRNGQGQRFERPAPQADETGDVGLPGFITTPVRVPIDAGAAPADQPEVPEGAMLPPEEGYGRFPMRSRRRRRGRGPREDGGPEGYEGGEGGEAAAPAPSAPVPQGEPTS